MTPSAFSQNQICKRKKGVRAEPSQVNQSDSDTYDALDDTFNISWCIRQSWAMLADE